MVRNTRVLKFAAGGVTLLLVLAFVLAPAATLAAPGFNVVASGLDNPRGLAFGPEGALYVAEAGSGGSGPTCLPNPEDPTSQVCYGATGAVTRLWRGHQERLVSGLPSLASEDGSAAVGPTDISFQGRGGAFVVIGLGADPQARSQLGDVGANFGRLIQVAASGTYKYVADVSAYETQANPDGGELDSNPYAVLALPGKHLVADAGGNDLLQVDANGKISTLAVFPDREIDSPALPPGLPPTSTIQSVPNAITLGPDGAYYVGELTGFPFAPGEARVYRVVPGQAPEVYASGFTNIIDLAFDKDGNLYVLEIAKEGLLKQPGFGALIKVDPQGSQTELASEGLVAPTGLAIGSDGAIYISNFGIFAGQGEIIQLADAAPSGPLMSMLAAVSIAVPDIYIPMVVKR
jgi:hypothetical protein